MSASRGDRIAGAVGLAIWVGVAIWIALSPLALAWILFFQAFVLAGCVNFALLFAGRLTLFEVVGSMIRRRGHRSG